MEKMLRVSSGANFYAKDVSDSVQHQRLTLLAMRVLLSASPLTTFCHSVQMKDPAFTCAKAVSSFGSFTVARGKGGDQGKGQEANQAMHNSQSAVSQSPEPQVPRSSSVGGPLLLSQPHRRLERGSGGCVLGLGCVYAALAKHIPDSEIAQRPDCRVLGSLAAVQVSAPCRRSLATK